jgi:hypothetical protein
MANRNVEVFEADLGLALAGIISSAGLSGAAQGRIAARMRLELRDVLNQVIEDAFLDPAGFNSKTRNAYNIMRRGGVRVFGTTLRSLRGHIIGPTYILAQEEGAIIRPVIAKALAIPLPAALRPDGSPKLPSPRSWQNLKRTFIYKSKRNGRAYIAYKNNAGGLTLLYSLVDEVEIKAKNALARAWGKNSDDLIRAFGRAFMIEVSAFNLLNAARITTKGRRRR